MAFADSLHLTLSGADETLMKFHKTFARRAAKLAVALQMMAA
jgi:hypothetical protein